jgi:dihydrodipicolinate synthase/N-acetylneuraminate lyase
MGLHRDDLDPRVAQALADGVVIPAHPLALDRARKLDERRQRALARYYIDAGVGGLAVGVHTTQFAIRDHGLYEPVLRIAMQGAIVDCPALVMVAGAIRSTRQARAGSVAKPGLCATLKPRSDVHASDDELIAHTVPSLRKCPDQVFTCSPQ